MSERETARWPEDVQKLLEQGRAPAEVAPARARRLWTRIERSLGAGNGGDGGSSPPEPNLRLLRLAIPGGATSALAFVVGVFAVLDGDEYAARGVDAEIGPQPDGTSETTETETTTQPSPSAPENEPAPMETEPAAAIEADPAVGLGAASIDSGHRDDDALPGAAVDQHTLGRLPRGTTAPNESAEGEAELIAVADDALRRGDIPAAAHALAEHRRRFPRGVFTEEREALGVGLLAASGQQDPARASAERFVTRYPQSIFRERVERALE